MPELALPYVPIDPQIEDSERYGAFVDALELYDDPNAVWKIIALLLWAGRTRPDGHLGRLTDRKLASVCRWPGDPGELRAALVSAGWLIDDGDGGYDIEGWDRHGGRVLKQRIKWRKNKRNQRGGEMSTGTSQGHPEDVPETSQGRPPSVLGVSPGCPALKGEGEGEGEERHVVSNQISNGYDLERVASDHRWAAGNIGSKERARAQRIAKSGAITKEEIEDAAEVVKREDPDNPVAFFLGVVERQRKDAAKEAAKSLGPGPVEAPKIAKDGGPIIRYNDVTGCGDFLREREKKKKAKEAKLKC